MKRPRSPLTALVVILTSVLTIGLTIIIGTDTGGHHTVTVQLGGPGHKQVALPPPAQQIAATQQSQDQAGNEQAAHADLRSEPPAAKSPQVLANDQQLTPPGQPTIPAHPPLATVNQAGCRTLPVRNFSSRQGAPVLLGVLHQTISPDDGWNGVLGNVHWFDTLAAQASSNYIVSRAGGQCAYIVPETQKAWAQAGFNRVALSIEVTERGTEPSYLPPGPGRARVIQLMIAWHHRWGIPYRHGAVSGCSVVRTGFVEHADLGTCGGGHHDDNPPCSSSCLDVLIAEAAHKDAGGSAQAIALKKAQRSHRIVHAKIRRDCRGKAHHTEHCRLLYVRNGALHAQFGSKL